MPERVAAPEVFSQRLYSGSVKDVYGIEGQSPYVFRFSDRYSIFDWGEMPDSLPGKGEALSVMGDLFFRHLGSRESWLNWQIPESYPKFWRDSFLSSATWKRLRQEGLCHHSLGLIDESGFALPVGTKSNLLAVQAISRPPVKALSGSAGIDWDYSAYAARPEDVLVPLEVVFRFGAPEGSSFLTRVDADPSYAKSFGFAEKPLPGEMFPYPIVEFFTKLEPTDRFLTREQAMVVAALRQEELDELVSLTLLTALRIRDIFSPLGLELWDGKFEFAFLPGGKMGRVFQLVDSIGPDELRLIGPGGVHFSKEFLRRVYRGSPWFHSMEKAKKAAKERGEKDWKRLCREEFHSVPEKLPTKALECARLLYPSLANELCRVSGAREAFEDVPPVAEVCRLFKELG